MNIKNPLYLPAGSVRSILALALTAAFIVAVFVGKDVSSDLVALTSAVVAFYFGSRNTKSTA